MKTYREALHAALAHPPENAGAEVIAQLQAKGFQAVPCGFDSSGIPIAWRVPLASGPALYVLDARERYFDTHFYVLSRTADPADAMTRNAPLSMVVNAAAAFAAGPKQARALGVGGPFGIWLRDPSDRPRAIAKKQRTAGGGD